MFPASASLLKAPLAGDRAFGAGALARSASSALIE
jgi:hypothetical protein